MNWTSTHWLVFSTFVVITLFLDLFVFHRKEEEPTFSQSLFWTLFWCSLALGFNGLVYYWSDYDTAIQFLTGYLVEWSLSMDNVFVFAVVFSFFKVPRKNQYRVLFWGILGAVVMRFIFIFLGSHLIERFHWIMWIFGAFLIFTGIKLAFQDNEDIDPEQSLSLRLAKKIFPVAPVQDNTHFFVRINDKLHVTPLFLVLIVIETTDVLFAVDSVPAIFGISRDPFIVFTSNIFAILGLRALYFLLAGLMDKFRFLHYGLSAILVFVGGKMVVEFWLPKADSGHWISPPQSLAVILSILSITAIASIIGNKVQSNKMGNFKK